MKSLQVKRAIVSSLIIYVLGVSAFLCSFLVPVLSDAELQANIVLMIAMVPAALTGAFFYYRTGNKTNGVLLGSFLFFLIIILDASITVPLFIIPAGGSHYDFFTDPGFWFIGLEYIATVTIYWKIYVNKKAVEGLRA